ncbi:MAG: Mini-ribonuclease 3 [Clostridiales bacterium]|nr:Mini-ribonuclease 3 [Clostridiales bacterium]
MSQNLQDLFMPSLSLAEIKELNPIVLAFIGDGVHTLFVRDKVVKNCNMLVGSCHGHSAKECNAKSQAIKLQQILPMLNEDEQNIVRRARNAKTNNIAKNSDLETYKKATSFEALVGYLYLKGDFNRLEEILKK